MIGDLTDDEVIALASYFKRHGGAASGGDIRSLITRVISTAEKITNERLIDRGARTDDGFCHPFVSTPNNGPCGSCGKPRMAVRHRAPKGGW